MSRQKKRLTRALSMALALTMMMPSPTVAYYLAEGLTSLWNETITLQDGTTLSLSDTESWEATYPQGIFALSNESILLEEGAEATITVYRLGGADGKAVAYFGYEPTVYQEEDGETRNYSMAISDEDMTLYIEDDQPMAAYQSIGGSLKTSDTAVVQSEAVEVTEDEEILYEVTLSAPADLVYQSIQWYVLDSAEEMDYEKIADATEDTLVVCDTDLETYDFRFTYEVDGLTYVSTSTNDVVYEEVKDYEGEIPDDVPLWAEQEFLPLTMDGDDPYSGYAFAMTFADGEYVKEIKLSALEDSLSEALESAALTIYFSDGAEIFTGAEKLIVSIQDDDPVESADISIDVDAITVDKSEGTAYIPVVRTGGTSNALTVEYQTVDGTAVAGTDYTATSGTLLFYAGIDTINIEVELIDDKIETADYVDFTVEISNLLGDGDAPSTITNATATVSLYNTNTATEENFATMMYDSTVDDVSAQLSEGTAAATVSDTVIGGTQNVIDAGASAMASQVSAWTTDNSFAFTEANVGSGGWTEYSSRLGYNASVSTVTDDWFYYVDYAGTTTEVKLGGEFGFAGDTEGWLITLDSDPTKYQYYDYMRLTGEFTTGYKTKSAFESWGGIDAVTQPYINVTSTSGNVATYAGSTAADKSYTESFNADFYLGYNGYDSYTTITAGQNSLKGSSLDDEYSYFWYIMNLNRREFTNTDNFVIVTANDANTAPEGAAVLSSTTYDALVPTFSLAAGGFGDAGKLFAGSQIVVSPSQTIGSFSQAGLCTYSSAIQGMYDWSDTIDTAYYIDTMDKINGTYTHYYVLNRNQDVQVDLSNSMDPEETNTAAAFAAAQTAFNQDVTLQFGVTKLQNFYSGAFDKDESWYDDNPFEDEPEAQVWNTDGTSGTYLCDNSVTNLQYIFFKSADPKDMITINGEGYISGEDGVTIWLTEAMLNMSTITIGYYASDYQSVPSAQKITMDSSYLYVDYSGNGKIDGSFDTTTNLFILDNNTTDELVMYIDPYTDYEESVFAKEAVYDENGDFLRYAEKFIVTKYTMNARAIQVPEGEDETTKTQVLASFISDATSQNPLYSALSTEQKTYRYITSGLDENNDYTSDNRTRYGAEATAMQVIIIPCGGDESPVVQTLDSYATEGDGAYYTYTWSPDFQGNLLYTFDNPSAITIPHSMAGDDIQLAVGTLVDGEVVYSEDEIAQLNGYLGSFVYIDTFALTVREQVDTTAEILGTATASSEVTDVEDAITQTADSTVIFSGGLRENSDYLQNMEAAESPGSSVDTADRTDASTQDDTEEGDMFDMDLGVSLPSIDIPMLADWLTIVIDDQSVGFSIGIDLGGYEASASKSSSDTSYTTESGLQNTKTQIKDAYEAVTKFASGNGTTDSSYNGAKNAPTGDKGFSSHTFSVGVTVQIGMLFTYNNLTGNYEFDTCTVALSVELTYKYQYRFVSVPVLYVYIQVSGSFEIGVGLGVDYIEQSLGYDLIGGAVSTTDGYTYKTKTLAVGEKVEFSTNYDGAGDGDFRAFNITFNGKLYLSTTDPNIRSGVIESDGSEPMTIVLTKDADDIPNCTVTLTATEGTTISKIDPVTEPVSRVYFTGLEISPAVGVELGVGVGIEVLKIELFANVGVSATFIVGGYERNPDDMSAEYNSYVDAFAFAIGLGLRLVALVINIEIDLVNYNIEYDHDDGWSFYGSAFNGALEFSEDGEPVYVKVTLAGNPADSQTVYLPSNDNITAFAYQPTDNTNVPFEYSGYSGSGDAFKLVDGVQTGYDYQVVSTSDGRNFVVYTLGRAGTTKATQSMMLVMSEILVTNESGDDVYGLVHPNDYTSETNYIVIDTDEAGDLGFNAWAEGKVINVAWVSYTDAAVTTETTGLAQQEPDAAQIGYDTAKQTVVKTASMNTEGTGNDFTVPSATTATGASVSLPRGDGEVLVYAEATHYTAQELSDLKDAHQAHTTHLFASYAGEAEFADFVTSSKELSLSVYTNLWNISGKASTLTAVVDGNIYKRSIDNQIIVDMEMVESGGSYYVAYTTQQFAYENNDLLTTTRLYLIGLDDTGFTSEAKLLRTVMDSALDDALDGVYSSGSLIENGAYQSPYISSLSFLNGKIGDKLQNGEAAMMADVDAEDFLLFEMNGTTYIIRNDDLDAIVKGTYTGTGDGGQATLYPFFQSDDGSPTGRLDVTIGADSDGNVAAVYTSTVDGSLGNALYIAAYDADNGTWSDGTILAMRGLQIYEDSAEQGWSTEELRYAYLYASDPDNLLGYTNEYGTLDQFTFSNVQIAMGTDTSRDDNIKLLDDNASVVDIIGEDTLKRFGYDIETDGAMLMSDELTEELWLLAEALDADQDGLLILTQGSMVKLTDSGVTYADDDGTGRVSVQPDYDHEDTQMGIYAINFGFGEQAVGNESLSFTYSNYTVDSVLNSYISFTNTGDTAIRASEANPATVNLYVKTTGDDTLLASWSITKNVKSGASIALSGATIALPTSLTTNDYFYFTVSEDEGYVGVENAFSYSSTGSATGSITVEEKAELAVENLTVTPQSINADGNMVATVSFDITNRGSKEADNIYVQFAYESGRDGDGIAVYAPFDLTNHTLEASNALNIDAVETQSATDLAQGVLNIASISTDQESKVGVNQYRHVEGTIIVQPEYFSGIAGELNLTVEVASDETVSVSRMSDSVTISGHDEYNTSNNSDSEALTHMTTFTAPSQIVMAMGNTARIAVSAINTTGTAPVLVAMEAQDSSDATANLGICYYDSASGTIVIVPSAEGTGKINLTDVSTNQTYAIDFTVTSESHGINIFNDNAIFAFYNSSDVLYVEGDAEYVGWDFVEDGYWGYDSETNQPIIPVNSDYVRADAGSYFTFTSVAESIYLLFSGSIEVYSTYDGSVQRFESDGSSAVEIDFENTTGATHIIQVTATANDTIFDTVAEDFTSTGTPTPSEDKTAPQIFWSRSFPDTASIATDSDTTITLTAYVLDDTGLASILVNGTVPTNLVKNDDGFWQFDLEITENGTYTITARDIGGTSATQNFTVDWFADTVSGNTVSTAPTVSATLYKNDDTAITTGTFLGDSETAYLEVSGAVADASDGTLTTTVNSYVIVNNDGVNGWATTPLKVSDSKASVATNGYYEVYVETAIGTWARTFVKMSAMDSGTPVVVATFDEKTNTLTFSATKEDDGGDAAKLQSLTVNDQSLATGIDSYTYTGSYAITLDGAYSFTITDEAGKTNTLNVSVTGKFPIIATPALISDVDGAWNANLDNGSFVLNEDAISGGQYDATASDEVNGAYIATYQYTVVNVDDDFTASDVVLQAEDTLNGWLATQDWAVLSVDGTATVDNLEAGTYAVYIQSENGDLDAVRQEVTIEDESMSITADSTDCTKNLQDGTITITATGGKDSTGLYQFAYEPLTITTDEDGITDTTVYLEAKEYTNWVYFDGDTAVFEGVLNGDYQVAVRMAEGITDTTAYDTAKANYEDALTAYESAQTALEALKETDDGYATALADYEAALVDSEAKLALYEAEEATLNTAVDGAYTANETLWENATLSTVTVGLYTPPSSYVRPSTTTEDEIVIDEDASTATMELPEDISDLTTAQLEALLEANEDYAIILTSDTLYVVIPAGLLTDASQIPGLLIDTTDATDGNIIMVTDAEGNQSPLPLCTIDQEIWYYIVSQLGTYSLEYVEVAFDDVAESYWGAEAIEFVVARGLFTGIGDDMFAPEDPMTRAMFVTVLGRLSSVNTEDYSDQLFDDVDPDSWYGSYVAWANTMGIVNGYSAEAFGPNDLITREQMCVMLANYIQAMGLFLADGEVTTFTDESDCSSWATEQVSQIASYGLILGTGEGAFEPKADATRAAVATIFMRFIQSLLTQ